MAKKNYVWIWESELKKYADYDNETLAAYLKNNPKFIRYPDGDYGDKKMYIYILSDNEE